MFYDYFASDQLCELCNFKARRREHPVIRNLFSLLIYNSLTILIFLEKVNLITFRPTLSGAVYYLKGFVLLSCARFI
jgi:hypothetical protein